MPGIILTKVTEMFSRLYPYHQTDKQFSSSAGPSQPKRMPSLGRRILGCMILVGLLPVIMMSVENHLFSKKDIEDSENGHLGYVLKSRHTFLEAWLHHTKKEFYYAAKSRCSVTHCTGERDQTQQKHPTCKTLQGVMRGHAIYDFLAVYDKDWSLLVTTAEAKNSNLPPLPAELRVLFEKAQDFIAGPLIYTEGKALLPICQPSIDEKGLPVSFTVGFLNVNQSLERILGKSSDIGETGRFILLAEDGRYIWVPEYMRQMVGTKSLLPESLFHGPYRKVTHYRDQTGTPVLGITARAEEGLPWILLAQIDEDEAYQILNKRMLLGAITGLAMLTLTAFVCISLSTHLSRPLQKLALVAHSISSGRIKERAPEFSEQETREVSVAFNTMLDRLAASRQALTRSTTLAAIGELSSSIAHEMRNPLASMRINLQAIADRLEQDQVYSEITTISVQQVNRLEDMLSDLMNYAAPIELNLESVTFERLAGDVLRVVGKEAAEKKVTIHIEDHLQQQPIMIDVELMTRAVTNLVKNGVQWAPAGGDVYLSGYPAPGEQEWVLIRVRDNGPGIRKEMRSKIFKLFYTTRENGHGIGLANVRKIIEYHGGFVAGDSAGERGAVFSILLPIGGPES